MRKKRGEKQGIIHILIVVDLFFFRWCPYQELASDQDDNIRANGLEVLGNDAVSNVAERKTLKVDMTNA